MNQGDATQLQPNGRVARIEAFLADLHDSPRLAIMLSFAGVVTQLAALIIWTLASIIWGPVTHSDTKLERIVENCDWRGCSYNAFDGTRLYPITQLESLTLKAGQRVCVTTPALQQAQLTPGTCPTNQGATR